MKDFEEDGHGEWMFMWFLPNWEIKKTFGINVSYIKSAKTHTNLSILTQNQFGIDVTERWTWHGC